MRVLIVDDEISVRLGLRNMIPWQEHGFEIVGEADNGLTAMDMLKKTNPDILITDLKMPVIDGIELIKRVSQMNFKGEILVLSNYDDFELVRDSMKYGAKDYLMKLTLTPNELLNSLQELASSIKTNENTHINVSDRQEKLRRLCLEGGISDDYSNFHLSSQGNCLLYCRIDNFYFEELKGKIKSREYFKKDMLNLIHTHIGCQEMYELLSIDPVSYVIILSEELTLDAHKLCKRLIKAVNMYMNLSMTCVYTHWSVNRKDIKEVINLCKEEHYKKFYSGDNTILLLEAKQSLLNDVKSSVYMPMIKELHDSFEMHDIHNIEGKFTRFIQKAQKAHLHPKIIKKILLLAVNGMEQLLIEGGINNFIVLEKLKEDLKNSENMVQLHNHFIILVKQLDANHKELSITSDCSVVKDIEKFIHGHLNEKVTLNQIAGEFSMNSSYISRLFKRELECSITDYIISAKLKRAKKLLKTSSLMVKEIADEVGMDNPYYFSRMFKKVEGMTPREYRSKHQHNS